MAHRLPPAGIKSEESEHFEFCRVIPVAKKLSKDDGCVYKPGACLLRPKFAVVPTHPRHSRGGYTVTGGQECVRIRCLCEDDSGPQPKQQNNLPQPCECPFETAPAQNARGSSWQEIIILRPPECETEAVHAGSKWPGTPGCHLTQMRRREVKMVEQQRCPSPKLVEISCCVAPTGREAMEPCQDKLSTAVNVGSTQSCFRLSEPVPELRCIQVIAKDCRPKVPDFRRRKPAFSQP